MSDQLTLTPKLKPSAQAILGVLMDGKAHSALEFKRGVHGFYADAVAQRVSEINAAGYTVSNIGGNRVGVYVLRRPAVETLGRAVAGEGHGNVPATAHRSAT